jgi:indolepyruvate ferredoxin oxidoreductase alpha subunit
LFYNNLCNREVKMDIGKILLNEEPYTGITMGNAALVRGMIEAGVDVITSYPGSPTPEIADAVKAVRAHEDVFYFEFSVNEKVASEVAFGASISGSLSVVFFKSVGLNVAADSFVQFSLMDVKGGLVIILGDDPGANSSQNEQ